MMDKNKQPNFAANKRKKETTNKAGYPPYPPNEDIYNQFMEEVDIDPENVLEMKPKNEENWKKNGLDVPNAEADDAEEAIGSEDEENNYYSIGGDNHNDLEENK